MDFLFFFNSILLGVGLAMDAFTVSLANGLQQPDMSARRMAAIAGTFAGFQVAMPLLGWWMVTAVARAFSAVVPAIPWVALALLGFIGGKMIVEGLRGGAEATGAAIGFAALMGQGVATSIDALSVGLTLAEAPWPEALAEAAIIGAVTFAICLAGLRLGRAIGTRVAGKAAVFGGAILVFIGLEIFIRGML